MSTATLQRETFLPGTHPEQLARILELLGAPATDDQTVARYFLSSTDLGEHVEIPAEVHQVLHQVVDAMRQGLAVTVIPQTMVLTTQQAADLLGISRPTLIKLLGDDQIPYERVGTHRRIQLRDLLAYRERRAAQYAALEATSTPIDDEDDAATVLASLRQARKVIADRRREQAG